MEIWLTNFHILFQITLSYSMTYVCILVFRTILENFCTKKCLKFGESTETLLISFNGTFRFVEMSCGKEHFPPILQKFNIFEKFSAQYYRTIFFRSNIFMKQILQFFGHLFDIFPKKKPLI